MTQTAQNVIVSINDYNSMVLKQIAIIYAPPFSSKTWIIVYLP